jgi:hypothetical protein
MGIQVNFEETAEGHWVPSLWIERSCVERGSTKQRIAFKILNQMELKDLRTLSGETEKRERERETDRSYRLLHGLSGLLWRHLLNCE